MLRFLKLSFNLLLQISLLLKEYHSQQISHQLHIPLMRRQQMYGKVHEQTMVPLNLPKFCQAAQIQIIAQISPWIDAVLPLRPLLPCLTKQPLYIHLRLHRLVELHLLDDLLLDRLIPRIVRDTEGLIIVGHILSEIDRIGSYAEMQMQDVLSLPGEQLFPQSIDVVVSGDSRHLNDGAGD